MKFIVVSGLSGSGKSSAINLLEDEGYVCIDNLPVTLLPALIDEIHDQKQESKRRFAIGIDARNINTDLGLVRDVINEVKMANDTYEIIYLDTNQETLIKRFSETRRRHPLSTDDTNLDDAIKQEKQILEPIAKLADITIDTSNLSLHQLRSLIKQRVVGDETKGTTLLFSSFGFKFGPPIDADLVFDVRCLPNPHWQPELRHFSGKDQPVIDFLEGSEDVQTMYDDIYNFVKKWLPAYEQNNRSYLTVAIGCTGGMHRSVYLSERLAKTFKKDKKNTQIKHRQLEPVK